MIQAASLAMGSSYYYSNYSTTYYLSIISSILLIIGGLLVTFRGLKMMSLTYFIATLTTVSTIFGMFITGIFPSIIAILIALLIACVQSMYQVGLFFVGMTMSVMITLVIYFVGVLLFSNYFYTAYDVVISATLATVISLVIGLCTGVCACLKNLKFIKIATCVVGGFRASYSLMALMGLTVYGPDEITLVIIFALGGVVFTGIGAFVQNVNDLKLPGTSTTEEPTVMGVATPVVIPVNGGGHYVSQV